MSKASVGDLDDMIEAMFPGQTARPVVLSTIGKASQSDWDSPDGKAKQTALTKRAQEDFDDGKPRGEGEGVQRESAALPEVAKLRSDFDDSDDDDDNAPRTTISSSLTSGAAAAKQLHHSLHTVPFPSFGHTQPLAAPCHQRCTLSSAPNMELLHPSLNDLRTMILDIHTQRSAIMKRKGAFHAYLGLDVGNGVDTSVGCFNIVCRRCDHPVIRLQGARWNDHDGSRDLYLVLRNYYPDWQRLAGVTSSTSSQGSIEGPVLEESRHSAAYCCQCSWATVSCLNFAVQTTAMDVMSFKTSHSNGDPSTIHCPFETNLVGQRDGDKRPPLWECKGHAVM